MFPPHRACGKSHLEWTKRTQDRGYLYRPGSLLFEVLLLLTLTLLILGSQVRWPGPDICQFLGQFFTGPVTANKTAPHALGGRSGSNPTRPAKTN